MNDRCWTEFDIIRLLDGEASENEAARMRKHIAGCASCAALTSEVERTAAALRKPLSFGNQSVWLEGLMSRVHLDEPSRSATGGGYAGRSVASGPRSLRLGGALAAAAMAAVAVVAVVRSSPAPTPVTVFSPRGTPLLGTASSFERGVGVAVYALHEPGRPLEERGRVSAHESYLVRYRSALDSSAYLLLFAVDARGDVHWICPAYLDAKEDPQSCAVTPSPAETSAGTAMQLEAPAPGVLRFMAVVTAAPLRVHDIERLSGAELSRAAIQAHWPAADVRDLVEVEVEPE